MITSIEIDGFKSLRNFRMDFRPGLNVLVGPNGSGKSNILQALELLKNLCTNTVDNSFTNSEEFGELFSVFEDGTLAAKMRFKFSGELNRFIGFHLAFGIYTCELVVERDELGKRYTFQKITFDGRIGVLEDNGRLRYKMEAVAAKGQSGGWEDCYLMEDSEDTWQHPWSIPRQAKTGLDKGNLDYSSLVFLGVSEVGRFLRAEIEAINRYSIDPKECIKATRVSTPLTLRASGERLPRILYALANDPEKHLHFADGGGPDPHRFIDKLEILSYFMVVMPDLVDFTAPSVSGNKTISVYFNTHKDDIRQELSIESLSDGQLCWITISVALISHLSGWLFDEPDRHLHVDMLRNMVSLFRDHAEEDSGWLLMTTHDETVLNECRVDEIQVVEINQRGYTYIRPVHDAEQLKYAIAKRGLQAGYWYAHGGL